jgi:hypothetical protein
MMMDDFFGKNSSEVVALPRATAALPNPRHLPHAPPSELPFDPFSLGFSVAIGHG